MGRPWVQFGGVLGVPSGRGNRRCCGAAGSAIRPAPGRRDIKLRGGWRIGRPGAVGRRDVCRAARGGTEPRHLTHINAAPVRAFARQAATHLRASPRLAGGRAMRLIHEVIEDLRRLPDEGLPPIGAALEELLGGERGSLPELADRFTEAGLADIMASWIGNGPNLADQHTRPAARSRRRTGGGSGHAGRADVGRFSRAPRAPVARRGASHDAGGRDGNPGRIRQAAPCIERRRLLHELEVLEARRIADLASDARKVRDRLLEKVPDAALGEPKTRPRRTQSRPVAVVLDSVLASRPGIRRAAPGDRRAAARHAREALGRACRSAAAMLAVLDWDAAMAAASRR